MLTKICLSFLIFNWALKCHNKLNSFQYIWKEAYIQGGEGLRCLQVNGPIMGGGLYSVSGSLQYEWRSPL